MNFVNSDSVKDYVGSIGKSDADKDAFKAKMKEQKEKLYVLCQDNLGYVNGSDDRLKELLEVANRFPQETTRNIVLIHAQRKDAVCLKTRFEWKNRKVAVQKEAQPVWLFVKGKAWVREDGKSGNYWNPTELFDAADTSAVVRLTQERGTQPVEVLPALFRLMSSQQVVLNATDHLPEGCNALFVPKTDEILIRSGISSAECCEALLFELCHRNLYQEDRGYDRTPTTNFEAYAAAYMISRRLELPVDDFQFTPEMFTAKDPEEMEGQLHNIFRAGHTITRELEMKITKKALEQAPVSEKTVQEPEQSKGGAV